MVNVNDRVFLEKESYELSLLQVLEWAVKLTEAVIAVGFDKKTAKWLACHTTYTSVLLLLGERRDTKINKQFTNNMYKILEIERKNPNKLRNLSSKK